LLRTAEEGKIARPCLGSFDFSRLESFEAMPALLTSRRHVAQHEEALRRDNETAPCTCERAGCVPRR
jgi:hypothetical protein